MVIKCPRKYKIYTKAKKGQILIITLLVMAIGLIIISPVLQYLDSSITQYLHDVVRTNAYYAADAMMQDILADIHSGIDVYNQNVSVPYSQSDFLYSGYNVNVSINYATLQGMPAPQGSGDWLYLDPGVKICTDTTTCNTSQLLGSLSVGATHNFSVYLVGGNVIKVNWTIDESDNLVCWFGILWLSVIPFRKGRMKSKITLLTLAILVIASLTVVGCRSHWNCCENPCNPYHFNGSMWMNNPNGSTIQEIGVNGIVSSGTVTSNTNPQLTLNFSWSIPEGANGNYTISFKNNNSYFTVSTFDSHGNGDCCSHNNNFASAVFSGDGAINRTWVAIGKQIGGQVYSYQDYMITATAKKNGQNIVSITAVVRHSPGPLAWWQEQTVVIPSWQVYYY